MKIIKKFINKTLSLLRLGHEWLNRLTTSLIEAARTNSYIETTSPTQSDTVHIKPLVLFNFVKEDGTTNKDEIVKAWAPKNLQWLTIKENLEKGMKY